MASSSCMVKLNVDEVHSDLNPAACCAIKRRKSQVRVVSETFNDFCLEEGAGNGKKVAEGSDGLTLSFVLHLPRQSTFGNVMPRLRRSSRRLSSSGWRNTSTSPFPNCDTSSSGSSSCAARSVVVPAIGKAYVSNVDARWSSGLRANETVTNTQAKNDAKRVRMAVFRK